MFLDSSTPNQEKDPQVPRMQGWSLNPT